MRHHRDRILVRRLARHLLENVATSPPLTKVWHLWCIVYGPGPWHVVWDAAALRGIINRASVDRANALFFRQWW